MTPTETAYLAGIVDGEGCIGVRRRLKYITPMLQVTNTKRELLDWISARVGGAVYENNEQRPGRNRLWSWQLWGTSAQRVIAEILPYLVIKKSQAELALTVKRFSIKRVGVGTMTTLDFERNEIIFAKFRELNRRGTRHS